MHVGNKGKKNRYLSPDNGRRKKTEKESVPSTPSQFFTSFLWPLLAPSTVGTKAGYKNSCNFLIFSSRIVEANSSGFG
jgi:hypothetical protein